MFLWQTDWKKRSFKGEQSLGNSFLWGERNLRCISSDEGMLGRKGKALKCQGVQKPEAGSLFSKALWPHHDKAWEKGGRRKQRKGKLNK